MNIPAAFAYTLAWVCLATPLWFIPVRRGMEHFGYPRTKSGRVRRASMVDWLGAAGCGFFAAALLFPLAHVLRTGGE